MARGNNPNYTQEECNIMLSHVQSVKPAGTNQWEKVTLLYNDAIKAMASPGAKEFAQRDIESLRRKFNTLHTTKKPTGAWQSDLSKCAN